MGGFFADFFRLRFTKNKLSVMSLPKNEKQPSYIVPMNAKAFKWLIETLQAVKNPLPDHLEEYLESVMQARYCRSTHILHEQDTIIDKAYFISSGYIIVYYFNAEGKLSVLRIYGPGQIVAGNSFMNCIKAGYCIKVYEEAYLLEITHSQMETGYKTIPGMDELARLTLASFEDKEMFRDEMIRKGGEDSVLHFYRTFPGLLHTRIIRDEYIASYLLMSADYLQRCRMRLIEQRILPEK